MHEEPPASEESSREEQESAPKNSGLERLLQTTSTGQRALNSRRTAAALLLLGCAAAGALWLRSGARHSWRATTSLAHSSTHAALSTLISLDEQSDSQENMASCVLNVDEAAFYLVQLGNFIKFSVLDCKNKTTLEQRAVCSASVGTVIASFGWVGSYVGAAVTACGVEDNVAASCAAGLSTLVALLGEFTFVSSAVVNACNASEGLPDEQETTPLEQPSLQPLGPRFRFLPRKRRKQPVAVPDERRAARISQCVVDVDLGLAYLGFLGVQSHRLSTECPAGDTKACGLDVFNVISSLGWAAQFLAQTAVDCPLVSNLRAGCAAVVGDFVASIASLGPYVDVVTSDCH